MPRLIDMQCPNCGFVEEILKERTLFEDKQSLKNSCPECGYSYRTERPSFIQIHTATKAQRSQHFKPILPLSSEKIMPEEVRKMLAKELFDPCCCGKHAPADLEEHEQDCHVQKHSFMKKAENSKET